MLAAQLRGACRSGSRNARFFSAPAAAKFNVVKFQQEDLHVVLNEVPDIPMYLIGNPEGAEYFAKDIPMSETVLNGNPASYFKTPVKPEWKVSQLENGLRIASIDKAGVTSKVAVYVNAGARHETAANAGAAHFTELMGYRSTAHLSYLRQMKTAEAISGDLDVTASREHIAYSAEGNRHFLSHLVTLVTGNVLIPRLLRWEVDAVKSRGNLLADQLKKTPAYLVQELLHEAAWYNNTLGNARFSEKNAANFSNETVKSFIKSRYEPKNMTIVGVNVDHAELAKWVARSFVDYTAVSGAVATAPAKYTGGVIVRPIEGAKTTQIAVAYKMGGAATKDASIAAVVKAALSGASMSRTFATGAAAANSRLATVFAGAKDAESLYHAYSDSGIWGLRVEVDASESKKAVETIAAGFKSLSALSEADWARAKAVVKGELALQTESVNGALDFVGKQLSVGDAFVTPSEAIAAVEKISTAEIQAFVKNLAEPSVAITGNIKFAPHADELKAILKK